HQHTSFDVLPQHQGADHKIRGILNRREASEGVEVYRGVGHGYVVHGESLSDLLKHGAIEVDDSLTAPDRWNRSEFEQYIFRVEARKSIEIGIAECRRIGAKRGNLAGVSSKPRKLCDALAGRPAHRLQLHHLAAADAIPDEEFHRDEIAGAQVAEREFGPLLAGVEVHVDLGKQMIALLKHVLRTHDLADAIVGPIEEGLELF